MLGSFMKSFLTSLTSILFTLSPLSAIQYACSAFPLFSCYAALILPSHPSLPACTQMLGFSVSPCLRRKRALQHGGAYLLAESHGWPGPQRVCVHSDWPRKNWGIVLACPLADLLGRSQLTERWTLTWPLCSGSVSVGRF